MGSAMVEVAEDVAGVVVKDVLGEAVAEMSGRSGRKWALVLLALVLGATLAALVARKLLSSD